jgi:hypothetical protein
MRFVEFSRKTGAHAAPARRRRTAATWSRAHWPAGGVAALGAIALALSGATAAQAQPVIAVACSQAALATAITDATNGATLSLTPLCVYTLTAALPAIDTSITIKGHRSTIERSSAGSTPDFSILAIDSDGALSITQVTLSNAVGSAISNDGGPLTVTASTLSDNNAGEQALGGAIFNGGDSTVRVGGSVFTDNAADNGLGGAIYSDGGLIIVSGSAFSDNTAGGEGGAILNDGGTLIVTQTTFRDNGAFGTGLIPADIKPSVIDATGDGGAIFSDGVLIVGASTFTDNSASQIGGLLATAAVRPDQIRGTGEGGAIFSDGSLTITNSIYTGNSASTGAVDGIGVRTARHPAVTVDAGLGGAIFSDGDMTVTGSTVTMSFASGNGGGIYNFGRGILNHSHVQLNAADDGGGGIFNDGGTVTLNATTVALNQPDNCESLTTAIAGCFF